MFNRKKIEELEKRVKDLEKLVTVGTGEFAVRGYVLGYPMNEEKTIPIKRVLSAVLQHLGVKLVIAEAKPECATLEPIMKPTKGRKK